MYSPPLSEDTRAALAALRAYLDEIDFVRLYKYIASPNLYYVNPHVATNASRDALADMDAYLSGRTDELGLLKTLLLDVPTRLQDLVRLPAEAAEAARRLAACGLLRPVPEAGDGEDGALRLNGYQLISAFGMPLLVDARVNLPAGGDGLQATSIGADTLLLGYYLDLAQLRPEDPVLDLGTGCGALGLLLSRRSQRVVGTDIDPEALHLCALNRALNQREDAFSLRQEPFAQTLAQAGPQAAIVMNPPYVAVPEGLNAPVFARGAGADGLDECRRLLRDGALPRLLLPGGAAYLVAELPGSQEGPHFVAELRRLAAAEGLRVEVYLDHRSEIAPGSEHLARWGAFLHQANPAVPAASCEERLLRLLRDGLSASHLYLAVMVVRRGAGTVRVCNRYQGLPQADSPAGALPLPLQSE